MVVDTAVEKAGNWDRPCLDCFVTPTKGATFASFMKDGKLYRKGPCRVCSVVRSTEHDRNNPEQAKAREARRVRDWSEHQRRRLELDPLANKKRNVKRNYGIDLASYEQRLIDQDNKCSACAHPIAQKPIPEGHRQAVLDHCHATGQLRKFLCDKCNVAIGMTDDNPSVLRALAAYLEGFE